MNQKKKIIVVLITVSVILIGIIGYLTRYHFLPIDYLTRKAEDACIVMHDNNADKAKKCICKLRSMLVIIPEKDVRPLIVKTINKDKIGVKRIMASNVTFMNAILAAGEDEECNNARMRFHNGLIKTYYPNGKVSQEQLWKNDKLTHIMTYYDNGNIESDVNVLDADENGNTIKQGTLKLYYKNGQLARESYYKKDILDGTYEEYYENGSLKIKTTYKNGQPDGLMKLYYENGNINQEINLQKGERNGITKEYRDNGSIKAEGNYKNGKLDGLMKAYYENGNVMLELNMQNGERNGIGKNYRDDGVLIAETNYKNGKLEGLNKRFYDDGSVCDRIWNNDKRQSQKCYDKDGNEISLNGLVKFYYKNGQLESETNFINGKAEGKYKLYHTNGNIREEGTYKNDQTNGEVKQFDTSGKLIFVTKYKNGELIE